MHTRRTPENRFTFVGLLPSDNPTVGTSAVDSEVLDRLRELEADELHKATNQGMPRAARARHEGVATGISIAVAAIEASGIIIRTAQAPNVRNPESEARHTG
jgi:hypothetical protein